MVVTVERWWCGSRRAAPILRLRARWLCGVGLLAGELGGGQQEMEGGRGMGMEVEVEAEMGK